MNVTALIGAVLSSGMATLRDLDEHYSVEDCYDLLEVSGVNNQNARDVRKAREKSNGNRR